MSRDGGNISRSERICTLTPSLAGGGFCLRVLGKMARLGFVKILSMLFLAVGILSFVVPAVFKSGDPSLVALMPLLGILFLGVGGGMIVAEKICAKKP
jgi:hypothetical protein